MPPNMDIMRKSQEFDYVCKDLTFWDRLTVAPLMAIKWLQFEESFDGILFKGFQFQSVTNRDRS